ncbi:hypothetical protein [Reichenbachiella sp.]
MINFLKNHILFSAFALLFIFKLSNPAVAQIRLNFQDFGIEGVQPLFDYEKMAKEGKSITDEDSEYHRMVERTIKAMENRQIDLAIKTSDSIILKYEYLPTGYYLKGKSYVDKKRDSARFYFNKLLAFDDLQVVGLAHLELGYTYVFRRSASGKAISHFNSAENLLMDSPEPLHAKSYFYYITDRKNKALDYAKAAIAKDSLFKPSYYVMLNVWKSRQNHDMAHEVTLRMLEHFPDDDNVQLAKALLYFETGEDEFGIQILDHVIREDPMNTIAIRMKGEYHFRHNQLEDGFDLMMKYIQIQNKMIESNEAKYASLLDGQIMRALTYVATEMYDYDDEARKILYESVKYVVLNNRDEARKKLTKLESKCDYIPTGLLMMRASLFQEEKDSFYWRADNETVTQRDTTLYYNLGSLASYYSYYKFYKKAEPIYDKMIALRPELVSGLKWRGQNRLKLEQYTKAVQDFNIYLSRTDDFEPRIYEARAACYKKLGYLELAATDLQVAFEGRETAFYYDPFLDLFSIRLMLKDTTEALALADSALIRVENAYKYDRKVMKGQLFNLKGLVYMSLENKDLAVQEFSNAIGSNPYFDLPYFNRGKLEYENDEYQKAHEDFDQFLELTTNKGIGFLWRGKAALMLQKNSAALRDFKLADKNGIAEARDWYYRVNF